MEYHVHTLKNGIRILFVRASSPISHACILVNAGSRDEKVEEMGLAHFIEHMVFKQTEKRNTNQILNRLESVGADLNAYTAKEYTCIHASFLQPYLNRTLELFNDIVFHSVFPEDKIEKEKGVVLDEISSYQDQPEEMINDDFEDLLYAGHALGRNILGTEETVSGFHQQAVKAFVKKNYRTNQMVVAVLGNYLSKRVFGLGAKYFETEKENISALKREKPAKNKAVNEVRHKPVSQTHIMMGAATYSFRHRHKTGLLLLNSYFGGNGMSSVLNLQLREKYGIAYAIESNYVPLSDTGIFTLYFGTDEEKVDKALSLIKKEFKKLRENRLTAVQLQRAQHKFIGQIALDEENRIGLIISMAKSLLDYQKIDSLETVFKKIRAVTIADIAEIANDVFDETKLTSLIFKPG